MKHVRVLIALSPLLLAAGCPRPNSASAAHVCATAARVGATAEEIATALQAMNMLPEKIAVLVPLIQQGRRLIDANCAIINPAPHDDPTPKPPIGG